MRRTRWLVAIAALGAVSGARAGDDAGVFVVQQAGYARLRIDDGRLPAQSGARKVDAAQLGFSLGFRLPGGLQLEAGRSRAIHTDFYSSDETDIDMKSYFGAIGWRIPLAAGWHVTPTVGRGKWTLAAADFAFLDYDDPGARETGGWDDFWELSLSREVAEDVSLGFRFRDVDQGFGHLRSGVLVATFMF